MPRVRTGFDDYLGQRIRIRRQDKGLSQTTLGDMLGVTFQQVQKYEKGLNRISASKLAHVARALDTPILWFYGEDESGQSITGKTVVEADIAGHFLSDIAGMRMAKAFLAVDDGSVQHALVRLVEEIGESKLRQRSKTAA